MKRHAKVSNETVSRHHTGENQFANLVREPLSLLCLAKAPDCFRLVCWAFIL